MDVLNEISKLQDEFISLESDKERDAFKLKMRDVLSRKNKKELEEFHEAIQVKANETIHVSEALINEVNFKKALEDIVPAITWSYIAEHYFGKSRSWFSQRMNGYHVNNKEAEFSKEEKNILADALMDLSDRIRNSAHLLKEHCL
ncbi:DUF5053 domain-containing protein [Phocaeicola sp.]